MFELGGPVVDAVEIHSRLEQVRCAGQRHGHQVAAVGAAPRADAGGIDIRSRTQVRAGALNVVVLGCRRKRRSAGPRGNPDRSRCRCDSSPRAPCIRYWRGIGSARRHSSSNTCSASRAASGGAIRRERRPRRVRVPAGSGGRKSWPWIARPSAAEKTTCCGVTMCCEREIRGTRARDRGFPCRCGWRDAWGAAASERRNATAPASPDGAGETSMPWPDVSAAGVPPDTATFHRWRRSISPWLEENTSSRRSRVRAACSTSNAPGVSSAGWPPCAGNGVEMRPAVALPREDQAVAGPQQLVFGGDFAEHAAGAFARAPEFAPGAGFGRGNADGPGLARAVRLANGTQAARWDADECHAAAVGRPFGVAVVVGAGVEVAQGGGGHVVDADEAVVAAVAGESEPRAVRRPAGARARASGLEDRRGRARIARHGRPPDLAAVREGDSVALGGNGSLAAFADLARRGAIQSGQPDFLRHALGVRRGIGRSAADVDQRGGVGQPAQTRDLLAVIGGIGSDLAGRVARRLRHHDVADPS